MLNARKRRIAENEARFREINERLNADLKTLPHAEGETIGFVCECGNLDCALAVDLTLDEYRHARQDDLVFVVRLGHEIPDSEDVIAQTDRYAVVRKHAESAPVVER